MAGEAERTRDAGHDAGDERVEITIVGILKLESPETNVVERLVEPRELVN